MNTTSPEAIGFSVKNSKWEPVHLAMQELWLTGQVLPLGARLVVRHVFQYSGKKPAEVVYAFVLPRDATLRRFRIEGKDFKVNSDLRPIEEAQEEYEKGISEGHLATLARQYGDGLVNLSVGNLRPEEQVTVYLEVIAGVETHDDGFRFRFPFTVAPTYHPKARTIEVEPGLGEQELPENEFGDLLLPPIHKDAHSLHRIGFDLAVECLGKSVEVASPSHTLRVGPGVAGTYKASLARESDVPNRDLVLDVTTRAKAPIVFASADADGNGQFAAVIPSTTFGTGQTAPRRVVFVLDRSASMEGKPIEQAKKAVKACLAALSSEDSFGVVTFDSEIEMLGKKLLKGDSENREEAASFLNQVDARGGTELFLAIEEGSKLLREEEGDLFVVTDGQVAATEQIIAKTKALGIRVHVLGIGSAAQDRFLTMLARDTGGISRYLTARERVDVKAVDLFASAGSPLARSLSVEGKGFGKLTIEPELPNTVFADSPLVVFGQTKRTGDGAFILSWNEPEKGSAEVRLEISKKPTVIAETLSLLRGSRLITDAEAKYVDGEGTRAAVKRKQKRFEKKLQDLSRKYGLASRTMALVAVVVRESDTAGQVPETCIVPVGMPEDTVFDVYFNRSSRAIVCKSVEVASPSHTLRLPPLACDAGPLDLRSARLRLLRARCEDDERGPDDLLMELASRLESDGGIPGASDEERLAISLLAILLFAENGHSVNQGAFRTHVRRLRDYIQGSGPMHTLGEIRRAAHDCGSRLEEMNERLQWSTEGPLLGETAEASARCLQSLAELSDRAERQIHIIETLLAKVQRGDGASSGHTAAMRDLLDKRKIRTGDLWRLMGV